MGEYTREFILKILKKEIEKRGLDDVQERIRKIFN